MNNGMELMVDKNCGMRNCPRNYHVWGTVNIMGKKPTCILENGYRIAKILEKISAKIWSWIYQMNFMQLKSIYQKISTISKNTWIMLECKGRSIHIPQCVNWSTLSIHQPEFIKKYFVTFESIWFTRVKMLIKDVWVSKIDWDEELNKECKDAAVKSF